MDRVEAENYVYKSYLKAKKYQEYNTKDSEKRRPDLTKEIIKARAGTPCVLVTGSKGKGSVATMISQILQIKYKVGLMTSPHLVNFCERFKINGVNITDEEFTKYMASIQNEIDEIDSKIAHNVCVSPMGIQAALGLEYFNARKTDFNIFECGKGVKYDDVNNIPHQYAVINSIFLEHTRELGDTLEAIAEDKSHIINGEQKCVFVAEQAESVLKVLRKRAEQYHVKLKVYGEDFKAEKIRYSNEGMIFDVIVDGNKYKEIVIPLMGKHQAKNCALAMALCKEVFGDIDLKKVKENLIATNWPGRMEVISKEPFIILDACINAASCSNVKDVLKQLKIKSAAVIIGIPIDKDYVGVAREMAAVSQNLILTKSQNPHYLFSDEQCIQLKKEGIEAAWTESVEEAIDMAKNYCKPIVILGTTSVVAEVKKLNKFILNLCFHLV